MPIAQTVKYQLFWRDLLDLAKEIGSLSREEKDEKLEGFSKENKHFIMFGTTQGGVVEVIFDRNMVNYLKRHHENVDRFKDIFLNLAKRRYGSGREG